MTDQEIINAIKSDQELIDLAFNGADGDLAKRLSFTETVEHRLTSDEVIKLLGPARGGAVLASIRTAAQSNPSMFEVVRMLDGDGVDLSHNDAAQVIGGLESDGVINGQETALLAALPKRTVKPTTKQVSRALAPFRPEGKAHQLKDF